jgi:hypothetical protein
MVSRLHSIDRPKAHHTPDYSRGSGSRLFDCPRLIGSYGGWQVGGKLWLLPVIVITCIAAAYMIAADKPVRSQFCDALRELKIDGPKSCHELVWVRTKSHERIRSIAQRKTRTRRG